MKTGEEKRKEALDAPSGVAVPKFPKLSALTNGLKGVCVLAGATGVGKTTLARLIAYSVIGPRRVGVFLDLENNHTGDRDKATSEMLALLGGDAAERFNEFMLFPDDYAELVQFVSERPAGEQLFIVVDNIQLLADRVRGQADESRPVIGKVMDTVVQWAEAGHVVLALSQISRAAYAGRPALRHLSDSAAIERAASLVLVLWRPDRHDESALRLDVEKSRYGPPPRAAIDLRRDGYDLREVATVALGRTPAPAVKSAKLTPIQRAFVGREDQTLTREDLLRAKGMPRGRTADRRIKEACETLRHIERVGRGHYRLRQDSAKSSATVAQRSGGMAEAVSPHGH